jgi:hypothetical protein
MSKEGEKKSNKKSEARTKRGTLWVEGCWSSISTIIFTSTEEEKARL